VTTIDVHAHLYDRRYVDELTALLSTPRTDAERASAALLARISADPRCCEVSERVELMQRIGLDYQVLSLSIPFSNDGDLETRQRLVCVSNDCLAKAVQDHPRRFFAFATLPLPDVEASLRELKRCLDDLHMVGVAFGSNVNGLRLDDPELSPVFDELDRRGTTIFLHPNIPVCVGADIADLNIGPSLAYIYDTGVTVYRMIFSGMLERHRRLKIIVPHLGGMLPYLTGRLEEVCRAGRAGKDLPKPPGEYLRELYFDTLINHAPSLRLAKEQFGAERLMLGSDYPLDMSPLEESLRFLMEADLTETERQQVLGANSARVLGLPDP
jgi:predicted TIM-barrel fold metal-dependent hydrolase